MRRIIMLVAASAISLAPAVAVSAPTSTPPSTGDISPAHETGQPGVECEDFGEDSAPGQSADAPGSAFNEDGTSHSNYAGEREGINDKNTAASSQYDTGCARPQ